MIQKTFQGVGEIPGEIEQLFSPRGQFREFLMMYQGAVKEVKTKFEILNDDLSVTYNRNPIEAIKSRIKTPESIVNKMKRKGLDINMSSLMYYIEDVAGIRVICSFIDDIYEVANMLVCQDDVKLLSVKDYIKNPKPNGYRSYHMIIEIPVFFADTKRDMRVEIQFRTIAMDFWASLEHKMKYKKNVADAKLIECELRECADIIAETDIRMQKINNLISETHNEV